MSWVYGDRLYTSESDACRRQILTYKTGPRTDSVNPLSAKHDYNRFKSVLLADQISKDLEILGIQLKKT